MRRRTGPRYGAAAVDLDVPAHAIDEQAAIEVVDGSVEVVPEGRWTRLGSWPPGRGDVA